MKTVMKDMGKYLESIVSTVFIPYVGCLIDPRSDGYYWADKRFDTLQEAKDCIDRTYIIIDKSLNKIKK